MQGTDQAATRWTVTNADALCVDDPAVWVTLPLDSAPIAPTADVVTITVELSAAGLREQTERYLETLQIHVSSQTGQLLQESEVYKQERAYNS